jgi:hypothetical protein
MNLTAAIDNAYQEWRERWQKKSYFSSVYYITCFERWLSINYGMKVHMIMDLDGAPGLIFAWKLESHRDDELLLMFRLTYE